MANEIVLTSREEERQGGRQAGFVGREVGSTEETRTDALKYAGAGKRRAGDVWSRRLIAASTTCLILFSSKSWRTLMYV